MSIFQKSVLNKYLKTLDHDKVNLAFKQFQQFYNDKLRLFEIMNLKEENYQEGFLREVFVLCLGYTIRPDINYNLTTEYKNQTDSKKADGAIIKNNTAIGVIELKSAKTFNLDNITNQAFNYKNNQPSCRYVITSNFRYLRFYIDNATEYEPFDLFELNEQQFKILYLILSKDSIFNDIPLKMKEETKFHEETIGDKFYKDYKCFKDNIFENLVKNNTQYDKLTLFKKSQKLLDRFLFVYFAEDCGLCPPNSVQKIIEQWKTLNANDAYAPLYFRYQKLFHYLDVGKKFETFEFPAYNGGLFKHDELLDNENIVIEDFVLIEHCPKLSAYDFNTDIDVNILGRIFEHSLNEIEEITKKLQGIENLEVLKIGKRKKDGIFYTPKYITNNIVENTIGKLCKEKQIEFQISEIEINETYHKNGKITKQGKELYKKLQDYKNWLFTLKILDPACGSGAFLNTALDFLIKAHQQIDDLISDLTGDKIRMFDTDKNILENNIFGVDLNEESVEIAQLSLWLRTAKKDRKLSDLNNNIKCGNSLIDNPQIAGEKSFDWYKEFPEIMQNGGFDVVVGNPPYVEARSLEQIYVDFYRLNYKTSGNRINTFSLFIEKSVNLVNENGFIGMIIHRNLIRSNDYEKTRSFMLQNTKIKSILSFGIGVFEEVTGEMVVFTLQKSLNNNETNEVRVYKFDKIIQNIEPEIFEQKIFEKSIGKRFNIYLNSNVINLLEKITKDTHPLNTIAISLQGIIVGNEKKYVSDSKLTEKYKPILRGRDISRYNYAIPKEFVYYEQGTSVLTRGKTPDLFEKDEKILTQHVAKSIVATLDTEKKYFLQTINSITSLTESISNKYLLGLLNSTTINFYYSNVFNLGADFTTAVAIENLDKLPIKIIPFEKQQPIIQNVDKLLSLNKNMQAEQNNFLCTLKEEKGIENITTKLQNFQDLSYDIFKKELAKQKITFSLGNQNNNWRDYFTDIKEKMVTFKLSIGQVIDTVNRLIYDIYELTPEEIALIEETR